MTDAKPSERVQQSARHLERSAGRAADSADRTTRLAADRTVLAAERTYAAWVRTGLAALASGVGARALFAHILPGWFGALTGSVLIVFSAACFAAGVWRELQPGTAPPEPDTPRLPGAALIALNGFLVLVDVVVLVGLWAART